MTFTDHRAWSWGNVEPAFYIAVARIHSELEPSFSPGPPRLIKSRTFALTFKLAV